MTPYVAGSSISSLRTSPRGVYDDEDSVGFLIPVSLSTSLLVAGPGMACSYWSNTVLSLAPSIDHLV